jgi:hypothetical protein
VDDAYRPLAAWPDYLDAAWSRLRPICRSAEFPDAALRLRIDAAAWARKLPHSFTIDWDRIGLERGEESALVAATHQLEKQLSMSVLNIAILRGDLKALAERR